jgi:hypothetical protein
MPETKTIADEVMHEQDLTPEEREAERLETLAKSCASLDDLAPREILALPSRICGFDHTSPDWSRLYEREKAIGEAQARVSDEIAYARVLARRSELPDRQWTDATDLRREAWRDALWTIARKAVSALEDRGADKKRPACGSPEFTALSDALDAAHNAISLLKREDDALHGR